MLRRLVPAPIRRPLRPAGARLDAWQTARRSFTFDGRTYPLFSHRYNRTWTNERAVEIPLARAFLTGRVLEVGNVLSHYGHSHTVVDKYEQAPGVLNVDVLDYHPDERFDRIVAVSTMEHVGWDEEPREPGKAGAAITHLRSLLAPDGRLLVTVPLGHNPPLDEQIRSGVLDPEREGFLRGIGREWSQLPRDEALVGYVCDRQCLEPRTLWVSTFTAAGVR